MKFEYEAIDRQSRQLTGEIDADTRQEALRSLKVQGLTVIELEEFREQTSGFTFQPSLKQEEILLALQELATLLESGVSVADAVDSQAEADTHPKLKAIFKALAWALRKGEGFTAALKKTDIKLPDYLYFLLEAGELTGELAGALRNGVNQMEYDQRTANEFRNALVYPSVLVFSGIGAVILMFVFVVPKFAGLLKNAENLPFLADMVLTTGMWFNENLNIFLIVTAGIVVATLTAFKQPKVREGALVFLSKLPVFSRWLTESDAATWASVMSSMLSSKVELLKAMELAQNSVRMPQRKASFGSGNKGSKSRCRLGALIAKAQSADSNGV